MNPFAAPEHVRSHIASSAAAEQQKKNTENDPEDREYAAECRRWKDEYDRLLLIYMADPELEPMERSRDAFL